MTDERPAKELEKIMVRLPDGMRGRLAAAARANKRSVNAEVVSALEQIYPAPAPEQSMQNLLAILERLSKALFRTEKELRPPEIDRMIQAARRRLAKGEPEAQIYDDLLKKLD